MEVKYAYCSACDRYVRVAWTPEPLHDGHASIPDPVPVCLELGESCTGAMCPLFGLPVEVIRERLESSGLAQEEE